MQFPIPPLPQLVTVNQGQRLSGWTYTRRSYNLYIMIFCLSGQIPITEEGLVYTLKAGEVLVLDPALRHWGHRPIEEDAQYYYVYFLHEAPVVYIEDQDIDWKTHIAQSTKRDAAPPLNQYMFIPKYAAIEMGPVENVLSDMVAAHRALCLENVLKLQSLLSELFVLLQAGVRIRKSSRSFAIGEQVKQFLQDHYTLPIHAKELEERFHFHFDYISRCLKEHTGMTPLQYLHFLRLNEAKQLLANSDLSLPDIAEKVGMKDYNYFSRLFRQRFGISPLVYRKLT
jgi:AraC-like DNA-binding protein